MAPTLACDDVEDSNESVPSRDDNQEMETQEVAEDQTQVFETRHCHCLPVSCPIGITTLDWENGQVL